MATHGDLPVSDLQYDIMKKKISGQEKRQALEREVSLLQKMLKKEENMHEILERTRNKNHGSVISIPSFLPPKVKELLAELAMVEDEIARLEGEIRRLQVGLKHEKEVTMGTRLKHELQPRTPSHHLQGQFLGSTPSPLNKFVPEQLAFETKALHFISKAIKGDYNLNDFTLKEKMGTSRVTFDLKENRAQEDLKSQDRVPRKSGMIKSVSPLRDLRHPSPKPRENTPLHMSMDHLTKSLPATIQQEENIQKWHPNKLSEHIMKCLNFIYIRLLRTSRAMELEKSGQVARSLQFTSTISRSFRAETSLNTKTSLILQKEARQQDPYGIFDVEDSIPRDVGPYKNLVVFTSSSMDPKFISNPSSIPLLRKLRVLMNLLQTLDLRSLTHHQKLAFWINMYNACIMHGFLQYGVPSSPDKMLALMKEATLNIGGKTISASAIEHYILRKPTFSNQVHQKDNVDEKDFIIHRLFGLNSMDANVTFALSCGTRSSPAVRIYTAENVIAELDKSKLEYLQASIVVTNSKKIAIPELLHRNMLDFAGDEDLLVEWVCHQLPTSGSLRKSIVDCFRSHTNSGKIRSSVNVDELPYDFEFQYLLAV